MKRIKVSVACISYNQEDYIAEALEGFVSQKTDFLYEVIIADDKSTDKTPRIIKEYAEKYPEIIKPIFRTKNVGPQKNFIGALKKAEGQYIALCEGDDFWTDPLKLQKQADYLDLHKDFNLVFHPVRVFFQNHEKEDSIFPDPEEKDTFTINDLLRRNFIQTNSVMYRKINYDSLSTDAMPFDWYLHLSHVNNGKIGFINEIMAAYRRHADGLWWQTTQEGQDGIWMRQGAGHMVLYAELLKKFRDSSEILEIIDEHVEGTIDILSRIDITSNTRLMNDFVEKFPETCAPLLLSLSRTTYENYRLLEQTNDAQRKVLQQALETVDYLRKEKEDLINSRSYKIGNKITQTLHIIRRKK